MVEFRKIITVILALFAIFSVFSFAEYEWVPQSALLFLEFLKSLTPYLIAFNLLTIIGIFIIKLPYRIPFSIVFLVIVIFQFNSGITRSRMFYDSSDNYTVFYSNVLFSNTNYTVLKERIKAAEPDFVALLEMDEKWRANVDLPDYPYKSRYTKHALGMVFYSKYPIKDTKLIPLGVSRPLLQNEIELPTGTININVVHLPAPFTPSNILYRNAALKNMRDYLESQDQQSITLGDFNTTQFSPAMKQLVNSKKVFQSSTDIYLPMHNLLYTTWCHSIVPFICAGIDHALTTDNLTLRSIDKLQDIGSDHIPLLITFSVGPIRK